jgi:hypothetical protein
MTVADGVRVTEKGLFIPHEAYESFGEIEVVRTPNSIIIQPKSPSPQRIIRLLQQTGLLLNREQLLQPERVISPEERANLAHKFGTGRPLSEIIIEERDERW